MVKKIFENNMKLEMDSVSENESLARMGVASFLTKIDPTLEEINDIKTAVSEAVTVAAVHGHGAQCAVVVRRQPQPELHKPHLHADSAPPQRRARPRCTAQVALRVDPRGVQRVPCALSDHAVRRQALLLLERPHGPLGCRAVAAVHRHAHQRRIKLR